MKRFSRMFTVPTACLYANLVLYSLCALLLTASPALADNPPPQQGLIEVAKRPQAPDFFLEDMDGKKRRLSDLRGKVVLVNFWATWCPPCRREMPSIERLSHRLKKAEFEILAVNIAESLDTVFSFIGTLEPVPTFPIVFDKDSSAMRAWPVRGLPTTFILDKQGRIAFRAVGGREFDDPVILAQLQSLLDEKHGNTNSQIR